MHKEANLALTLSSYLNKLGRPNTLNATYQVPRSSTFMVLDKIIKGFLPCMGVAAILLM